MFATGAAPGEKAGVFHLGTHNAREQNPKMFRAGVRDLAIRTAGADIHRGQRAPP